MHVVERMPLFEDTPPSIVETINKANLAWVLPRWKEAFNLYSLIADKTTGHYKGHVAYRLGLLYKKGIPGKPEPVTADKYLKTALELVPKSAEEGDCEALCDLGHMYENGHGVESNEHLAVKYYRDAAERGYPRGQYNLAVMLQSTGGKPENKKLAMEYYISAAKAEYPCAQFNLACMYFRDKDYKNAIRYYVKAASWGDGDAQKQVSKMFREDQFIHVTREFLAEEWTTYFDNIHPNCKNIIIEIHCILRNIQLSYHFPTELIGVITKKIVLTWPKEDRHFRHEEEAYSGQA